ncbi:hypothetical protein BCU70_02230 [Vibrio sp. 10N.286.49.C2]|uniref:hypothetical protein n=1 Tax=unclassified Vibrio TaxID=2614977 RepID=UPI000C84F18E|nr:MULTISPECIES: hypothetical protein [unclassified Vibrio]PMH38121.1 hypothetical protein BCU70_02230 [Vibrio sp. 10N.286.49.C2]PMH53673.1 hypothetical protein BCU66_12605 [Vibrio sp. 10N.286.49.B1]PMH82602.1 hypothetical protein BCU58_17660 [Vibrio sp. 10N.286.48.B7]
MQRRSKSFSQTLLTLVMTSLTVTVTVAHANEQKQLGDWVHSPSVDDGLAAVGCASSSGNFSLDKKRAESQARTSLIQSINMKATNMDRHATVLVSNTDGTSVGETFESVSKQISQVRLRHSQIVKLDVGEIFGQRQVCAMAVLDSATLATYFDDLVASTGAQIDPNDQEAMYEEFKTQKAMNDLESELKRLTQ